VNLIIGGIVMKTLKKILFQTAEVLAFSTLFFMAFAKTANAYLDPSVMTYAFQAIVGVIIAIGAAVGIYWRKAKKKVSDKLGVDENKNKEVESDEIIIKDEADQ
jgi:hypothetical protein